MYLLISRNAVRGVLREVVRPHELHIIFDKFNESRQSKDEGWRKKTRDFLNQSLHCEIEHLQPCDSHTNSFLQLIDVATSMLSEKINMDSASSLLENREQIARLMNGRYGERFDVWHWHPR